MMHRTRPGYRNNGDRPNINKYGEYSNNYDHLGEWMEEQQKMLLDPYDDDYLIYEDEEY